MEVKKELYRILSSKGSDPGIVLGFRVPKDFPLNSMETKLYIANTDIMNTNKIDKSIIAIKTKLTKYLDIRRKQIKEDPKDDKS